MPSFGQEQRQHRYGSKDKGQMIKTGRTMGHAHGGGCRHAVETMLEQFILLGRHFSVLEFKTRRRRPAGPEDPRLRKCLRTVLSDVPARSRASSDTGSTEGALGGSLVTALYALVIL